MANQGSILGGSPLGLIGVRSLQNTQGMSSFNSGTSRNLNVDKYNKRGTSKNNRLTTGEKAVRPFPTTSVLNGDKDVKYAKTNLHNDTINDLSILNIIEQLAPTKGALRPADFAYLKDVGVFPNNRLMIARRFSSAIGDNIFTNGSTRPMAVLVSWKPQDEDFLEMTFNEEWVAGEADFKNVLNDLGEDFMATGIGGITEKGGGVVPLPGFTEILQRRLLQKLGVIKENGGTIPNANPNLIKESKTRKMVKYSEADSGLKCTVNIKMVCEYEMKFISGIDPTIAWMEIISNILRFGTSESVSWGMTGEFSKKIMNWVDNPTQLITDIVKAFKDVLKDVASKIKAYVDQLSLDDAKKKVNEGIADIQGASKDIVNSFTNGTSGLENILKATVSKYKFKILGITKALTGAPSTPWHITIGNPMRPTFCAGDMYLGGGGVNLKLGATLGFNNLPSSIKAEFTLENARPWGMQEIIAKFNSGYLRVVDVQKSFDETNRADGGDFEDRDTGETNITNPPTNGATASPIVPLGDSQKGNDSVNATQSNDVSNTNQTNVNQTQGNASEKSGLIAKNNNGDTNSKNIG